MRSANGWSKPGKRTGASRSPQGGGASGGGRGRSRSGSNRGKAKDGGRARSGNAKSGSGSGSASGARSGSRTRSEGRDTDERGQKGAGPVRGQNQRRRRPAKGLGGDQVEGRQAVRELLLAGKRRIDEVIMIEDMADAEVLQDIEELSHEFGVSLRKVSRRHMVAEALTESHQGVIARGRGGRRG